MRIRINFIKIIQLLVYLPFMLFYRILFDFKVSGTDKLKKAGDSFILAVNHISYLDPMAVSLSMPFRLKYLPLFYMAYDYLYDILFFYRFVGAVRSNEGKDLDFSCRQLIDILANGGRVVIYPEGSINRGVKMRPRRGISYVAAKSNKLIVPLKIGSNLDGSINNIGGKVIDLLTRKHWIKVVIGEPFKIEDTIGKIPENLKEFRLASEDILRRIETAS
ncbi:1-acyl-sn-glycerol-3-phosphate acyltransferase [Candidatus Scalindua japonica]|uniref:1-acyl-sn-glycerol-3-phosphate acyltransferase n=2 Tax=Candidatus Scalindua japonica TaxID=1284222 RepID=A0A286TZM9_9BACT|nr:1-acyl-sn-glycerol-3-phosphate acyltransferase [Candidatus Scalindua japonica]